VRHRASTSVSGTDDDALYNNYGFGDFSYDIAVPHDGTYGVTLYLTEPWANKTGKRVFDARLEGESTGAFNDIDLYAIGGHKWEALTLTETVEVADGVLNLDVQALVNDGILSAFSVFEL
jgi:hypothetical protein